MRGISATSGKEQDVLPGFGKAEPYLRTKAACRAVFERNVRKHIAVSNSGCWIVGLKPLPNGYTMAHVADGIKYLSHRLAYRAFIDSIPGALHVLHRCDVPACCNPAHLFLGTPADNARDQIQKGRPKRGGKGRFLLPSEVSAIRASKERQATLAARHHVSLQTISLIKRGRIWRGVQ